MIYLKITTFAQPLSMPLKVHQTENLNLVQIFFFYFPKDYSSVFILHLTTEDLSPIIIPSSLCRLYKNICFMYFFFFLLLFTKHFPNVSIFFLWFYSERRARAWGAHGERKTKKDPQAENDLFQLPARCAAEALPEGAVPCSARESGACGSARTHADAGRLPTRLLSLNSKYMR